MKMEETKVTETAVAVPEKKKTKKIKPWMIFTAAAVVVFVVLIGVFVSQMASAMSGMGTPVEVTEALKGNIAQTVDTSGTVSSEESKTYFADVTAQVDTLNVMAGQSIKKGDVLLSYNTEDLEDALYQTELESKISTYGADAAIVGIDSAQKKAADAAVNYEDAKKYVAHYTECVGQANAQLGQATALSEEQGRLAAEIDRLTKKLQNNPKDKKAAEVLEKTEKEYKKVTKELKNYDIASIQSSLETCSADLAEYKALMKEYEMSKEGDPAASLSRAQQSVMKESAQHAKKSVADQLEVAKAGVKADFDGIVSEVTAVAGQTATEGMQLFTVYNSNELKVTLAVTKYDMNKLALGQKAEIKINENEYVGTVSNISRIATMNSSGTSTVNVDIHIDNPDENIILGMDAKVSVQTAEEKDILIIPSASVNYSSKGVFCYVLADGIIEKREIETGISDDEFIQVVSGLKEGDKVVTNVTGTIQEGMPATAMEPGAMMGEQTTEEETDEETEE